ncbi:MFS general substrate transporter [Aspergillus japonicus CBS 114.51]|uniref:MFS general substrate transporter n=1 Tax=Aspergillus japonicus CBS 114.51 TaxID=1448312 RepID=A0A8T8WNA8_ASPJA|nr:MFS general substrate transporter [Aspergillus japonicus CBS 114.51]RAH76889.1 MFS general substrate transporter [Aspergillus japonicus CBS 114.51]
MAQSLEKPRSSKSLHAATMSHDSTSTSSQPHLLGSNPTPWEPEPEPHDEKKPIHPKDEYEPEWVHGLTLVMVIAGITLVVFLMLLDVSIVSTAIPKITSQFNSLEDVAWYGSAYTISSAALQPLTGKFYTYFSSKWTFLSFFGLFELGSLICGVATSSKMLIIGRAVAGMGSSGMLNGALNILAGAVPNKKRPAMIGVIMGVGQLGLVGGPLVGGAFTTYSTWRWCFYMNLPIGALVGALLLFTRIPDQKPKPPAREVLQSLFLQKFDLVGFVLFAPASIMLLLALQYGGNSYAWDSATVIGLFVGSAATFAVFALWERRMGAEAMIPGHLVCDQIVLSSSLLSMVIFGFTMTLSYYLPIYFQSVRGKSALVSGVNLLPNILCQLVMAVVSGVLTSKLGYYLPWGVLGAILDSVGNGLLSTLGPHTSVPKWAGYQALVGFGRGAISQVPMIAIQNAVQGDDVSTAMAMMTCAQTFGGAIFLAVAEVIFAQALRTEIPRYAAGVDAAVVIQAGATGFRSVVSSEDLPAVVRAFAKSVDQVFYLTTALSVAQFVFAWGVGWRSVKKEKKEEGIEMEA